MSLVDAVVTGFVYASCTAIMTYFVNRLVVRPLDQKLVEFEKWAKEKLPGIIRSENGKEGDK